MLKLTSIRNKNALVVFWQNIFLSLSTFLFVTVLVRALEPIEFSTANSLLGLFFIVSVMVAAVQISATKLFIKDGGLPDGLWKWSMRAGLASSLLVVFMYPFWQRYLDWDIAMTVLIAPAIGLLFPLAVQRGVLLGQNDFSWYARSQLVDNGIRLIGLPLVLFGPAAIAALISFSVLVAVLLTPRTAAVVTDNFRARSLAAAGISIVLFSLTYNVDLILVKHALSPLEAARYGVVSLVGKVPLAIAAMVTLYYLPRLVSLKKSSGSAAAWKVARKALLLSVAGMVLFVGFLIIAGPLFAQAAFGATYQNVGPGLWRAVLPFCLIAAAGVLLNYFIAVDDHLHTVPMAIFVVCEIAGLWMIDGGYKQALAYLLVLSGVLYLSYTIMFMLKRFPIK